MWKGTIVLCVIFLLSVLDFSVVNARPWKQLVRVKRSNVVKLDAVPVVKAIDAEPLNLEKRDGVANEILADIDDDTVEDEIKEWLGKGEEEIDSKVVEGESTAEEADDGVASVENVDLKAELEEVEEEEEAEMVKEEESEKQTTELEEEEEELEEADAKEMEEEEEEEEEELLEDEDNDDDEFQDLFDDIDFDSASYNGADDDDLVDDPLDKNSDAEDNDDGQTFWSYIMDTFNLGAGWQQELQDEMDAEQELFGSKEDEEGYLIGEDDGEFGDFDTDGVGYDMEDADIDMDADEGGAMTMEVVDVSNKEKQRLRRSI